MLFVGNDLLEQAGQVDRVGLAVLRSAADVAESGRDHRLHLVDVVLDRLAQRVRRAFDAEGDARERRAQVMRDRRDHGLALAHLLADAALHGIDRAGGQTQLGRAVLAHHRCGGIAPHLVGGIGKGADRLHQLAREQPGQRQQGQQGEDEDDGHALLPGGDERAVRRVDDAPVVAQLRGGGRPCIEEGLAAPAHDAIVPALAVAAGRAAAVRAEIDAHVLRIEAEARGEFVGQLGVGDEALFGLGGAASCVTSSAATPFAGPFSCDCRRSTICMSATPSWRGGGSR